MHSLLHKQILKADEGKIIKKTQEVMLSGTSAFSLQYLTEAGNIALLGITLMNSAKVSIEIHLSI